jgi:putative ABC transport system substrate-binding protein
MMRRGVGFPILRLRPGDAGQTTHVRAAAMTAESGRTPEADPVTIRRAFLGTLAGGVLAVRAGLGPAQTAGRIYRLGYLSTSARTATYTRPLEAFLEGLRELGWVEGGNIVINYRWAEGKPGRLPGLADELVRLKVDVIAASPTPAALAARNATRTIPIVGMGLSEPVAVGLVASLARPGGNVTGVTYSADADIFGKQLALLQDVDRSIRRVAFLLNPGSSPSLPLTIAKVQAAAKSLGVQLQLVEARDPSEFDRAFATMSRERAEALLVAGDPMFFLHRARLADLAARNRLPSMSTQTQWVDAGGLISYGPNLPDLWRRAAGYVDRILKGANPAELPIEQPTKFELVVNLRTAKALQLTIPQSLLLQADYVME